MAEQLLSGYCIRQGSTLDRALLVKFMQRTYKEMFPQFDFSHLAQTVEQYLSHETPLWWIEQDRLAEDKEKFGVSPPNLGQDFCSPVGCVWVGNAIDQLIGDRYAHVFLLYVVPEHRRRGIGKALMQYVQDWAVHRGDRQISLQVFKSNTRAINLYHQLGYQTQSLWMVKSLHSDKY